MLTGKVVPQAEEGGCAPALAKDDETPNMLESIMQSTRSAKDERRPTRFN
jgi:hypothetical protein